MKKQVFLGLTLMFLGAGKGVHAMDASPDYNPPQDLYEAAYVNDAESIRFFVDHGTDVDKLFPKGFSRLSRETALMCAARLGNTEAVRALIEKGAYVDMGDDQEMTALFHAARAGRADAIECLLENGALAELHTPLSGETALMIAAQWGYADAVKRLLAHGAAVDARSFDNSTPLIAAARDVGTKEVVRLLIEAGADYHAKNNAGDDAFYYAKRDAWESEKSEEIADYLTDLMAREHALQVLAAHDELGIEGDFPPEHINFMLKPILKAALFKKGQQ